MYKSEFKTRNRTEWRDLIRNQFGPNIRATTTWAAPQDIVRVLSPFCAPNQNHMFLPTGGGLDLGRVALSRENGCVELLTEGVPHILRPSQMTLETFPDFLMSYFRIDSNRLDPSGAYDNLGEQYEEVVEIEPLRYIQRWTWDTGYYEHDENGREIPLPTTARLALRFFAGSVVIFAKGSIYNSLSATYDARHNRMNSAEFRAHIEEMIRMHQQHGLTDNT
jgi:hypothetical protein